jgi:hypothetical protein
MRMLYGLMLPATTGASPGSLCADHDGLLHWTKARLACTIWHVPSLSHFTQLQSIFRYASAAAWCVSYRPGPNLVVLTASSPTRLCFWYAINRHMSVQRVHDAC